MAREARKMTRREVIEGIRRLAGPLGDVTLTWTPFKVGKLMGEETHRGDVRGEVFAPTTNPEAPKPVYWNVVGFGKAGRGKPLGLLASGFADTTDEAKAAVTAVMGA